MYSVRTAWPCALIHHYVNTYTRLSLRKLEQEAHDGESMVVHHVDTSHDSGPH